MSVTLRVASIVFLLFALGFGFSSTSASGANCGSVLGGSTSVGSFLPTCQDALAMRQTVVLAAFAAGAALAVAGFATRPKRRAAPVR